MIGKPNEITVALNNIQGKALLDSGATVSTISEAFYKNQLYGAELHSIEDAIHIECADGQSMPYLGYVCADLTLLGIPTLDKLHDCLFLVVHPST